MLLVVLAEPRVGPVEGEHHDALEELVQLEPEVAPPTAVAQVGPLEDLADAHLGEIGRDRARSR